MKKYLNTSICTLFEMKEEELFICGSDCWSMDMKMFQCESGECDAGAAPVTSVTLLSSVYVISP